MKRVLIIGAGAGGFFTAINIATKHPKYQITILEKTSKTLAKVRISGGGRCNVTHNCFKPYELVKFYPRGEKELLGPFGRFGAEDTVKWFERRGVRLKTEKDGRMFPVTNKSQTIVDCFEHEAKRLGIQINFNESVTSLSKSENWTVNTKTNQYKSDAVIVTAGASPAVWDIFKKIGHNIIDPVPSLFTFNIKDPAIEGLMGLSVENALVKVLGTKLKSNGPLLITHWGLSGPAILKLSAWGARTLNESKYNFRIHVNWTGNSDLEDVRAIVHEQKNSGSKQVVLNSKLFDISKRLWASLVKSAQIDETKRWIDLSKKDLNRLFAKLTECEFEVKGKSTFKDEFVTAGGVDLKEIDFKTFESKLHKGLYFAGEVLNIDAITGGFNFQNAWTGGWIISESV